jgi:hypothetical protein
VFELSEKNRGFRDGRQMIGLHKENPSSAVKTNHWFLFKVQFFQIRTEMRGANTPVRGTMQQTTSLYPA